MFFRFACNPIKFILGFFFVIDINHSIKVFNNYNRTLLTHLR